MKIEYFLFNIKKYSIKKRHKSKIENTSNTNKNKMNLLPEDMIDEIRTFLSRKDFRSSLSISKKMQYLNLNKESSRLFASDNKKGKLFRGEVLSKIANPNKQLSLNLSCCQEITDVSMLGNVHTLDLSYCHGITEVSMLGNVHTLDLSGCSNITDVSMLGNVHTLNLSHCTGITDVSMLGNVHTLNLSWCSGITDVSMLRKVHKLNLYNCRGITRK